VLIQWRKATSAGTWPLERDRGERREERGERREAAPWSQISALFITRSVAHLDPSPPPSDYRRHNNKQPDRRFLSRLRVSVVTFHPAAALRRTLRRSMRGAHRSPRRRSDAVPLGEAEHSWSGILRGVTQPNSNLFLICSSPPSCCSNGAAEHGLMLWTLHAGLAPSYRTFSVPLSAGALRSSRVHRTTPALASPKTGNATCRCCCCYATVGETGSECGALVAGR